MKNTSHSPVWESEACRNTSGSAGSSYLTEGRTHRDTASVAFWWRHPPTCYQSHSFWSFHDVNQDLKPHVACLYSHLYRGSVFKNSRHKILSFSFRFKHSLCYWPLLFSSQSAYFILDSVKSVMGCLFIKDWRSQLELVLGCRRTWQDLQQESCLCNIQQYVASNRTVIFKTSVNISKANTLLPHTYRKYTNRDNF
jgi:hypothetical protein